MKTVIDALGLPADSKEETVLAAVKELIAFKEANQPGESPTALPAGWDKGLKAATKARVLELRRQLPRLATAHAVRIAKQEEAAGLLAPETRK